MTGRSQRILADAEDVDAIIISNSREPFLDPNFWYVTGAMGGLFESSLVVLKEGRVDAIVSEMEAGSARDGGASVHVYKTAQEKDELTIRCLGDSERIGLNYDSITLHSAEKLRQLLKDVEFKDVAESIKRCRSIKDRGEIDNIRRAAAIASKVAEELPAIICRGMTEQQVAARIDSLLRERGSEGEPFATIVAFGDNAAHPHHRPGHRVLGDGMTVLCDFGAIYGRYCSDLTRTMFCGNPDDDFVKAYDAVVEAQDAGVRVMVAGAKACEPDRAAREVIDAAGHKGRFIHSFGHEIGLSVHEGGVMSQRAHHVLLEGMVMSAEPGIYVPGRFGIRVEDTVHIKADGAERLTGFDRALTVI